MKIKTKIEFVIVTLAVMFLVYACANKSQGPTGGPKDKTPPRVLKSFPKNGAVNYNKKQIEIDFDEMVSVEKATENVMISPPQVKQPDVKSFGKKITVNFNENLIENTTYSVNFGNAIVDLNEKNPIKNYSFSFSTGNQIDTLKISGVVINAEDLTPLSGIVVGIYLENSDSLFLQKPFLRVAKTDEKGHFSINNIKKGKYKVFALGDSNHDYFYEPGEGLAMCDSVIHPTSRLEQMTDTIWKDSITVDSLHTYMGPHYLPDNIALRYFNENKKRQYFVKSERKEPFVFNLFFNTILTKLPEIKPLNFNWDKKYLLQKSVGMDTLTYWITDSTVWKTDTLRMAMTYLKTDSLFKLRPQTDTISVFMRKAKISAKSKAAMKRVTKKIEPLKVSSNVAPAFDVYTPIILKFEAPLANFDVSKISLSQKIDTTYKELPFKWQKLDSIQMTFGISYKWVPEKSYKLEVDSTAFTSIYNKVSNDFKDEFKIKSLDDYSSIKMLLATFNPKAVMQVLDPRDLVVATKAASEKGTLFEYLKPGDYYIRMFIDENGNGKWDPGDLKTKRQPEEVYYYPKMLSLKANWEFEETWNYTEVPLLEQKPAELIKASTASKKKDTPTN